MKILLTISIFFITTKIPAFSQATFYMSNTSTDECKGTLLDSENGQLTGHFDNNENYTFTICVSGAQSIELVFSFFCTEYLYDTLTVYDGPNTGSPGIGTFSGDPTSNPGGMPGTLTATSGCMTLHFVSDGSVTCDGWQASWRVEVEEPEQPDFLPIANPTCFSNSLTVSLDRQVPCDSIYPGAFTLTGPDAPNITNAVPVNCLAGLTNTIQLTLSPGITESGTYALTFTNYFLDACDSLWELTANGSFIVNDCPLEVEIIASDEIICPGDCIELEAEVTGGNGIYIYTWSNGLPATAGPHIVCPLANTTYSLTVDDTGPAASDVATKIITILSPPVITRTTVDTTICQNVQLFLTATPPGGKWQGPGMIDSDTLTGRFRAWQANLGNNIIYYTDPNTGCRSNRIINVIRFDARGWQAACTGSPPFMVQNPAPTGGYWLGPFIDSSGLFNPSTPGAHDVTYYAPNGCSGSKRVNVNSITMQGSDTVCSSLLPYYELTFSPLGGTWSGTGIIHGFWGRFNPVIAGAGLHTLTYTMIGGCSATVDLFVEDIYAGYDQAACPQQAPFLLPPGIPAGGTWSGIGIVNAVTGLYNPGVAGGDFNDVIIYNNAGCTDTLIMYVRQTKIFADTIRLCESADPVKLDFAEPWSGTWSGPGITVAAYPGYFEPAVAGPGTHTIYYSDYTCMDSMVFAVIPTPVITPVIGLCINSSPINLSATPPGGFWVHYLGTAITDPIAGTFDPRIAGIGTHAIVYVTLPDTCYSVYLLAVDTLADVSLNGLDNFYCHKDTNIAIVGTPPGGVFSGNGIVDSFFNPSLAGSGFHPITYTYGAGDCAVSDGATVIVGDSITVTSDFTDSTICNGDFVNLAVSAEGGTGDYAFVWNNGLSPGQFQTVNPAFATSYSVTVSDGCSDEKTLSFQISVYPEITVSYVTNGELCYGEMGFANLTVQPPGNYVYRWSTSPVQTTEDLVAPASSFYSVTITDSLSDCSVIQQVELPGYDRVRAYFIPNPNSENCITLQDPVYQFIDLSEGAVQGQWSFGDVSSELYEFGRNPEHNYSDTGSYTVSLYIRNEGFCSDSFQLTVCVKQPPVIFAPASFTPNGDGINDIFKIMAFGIYEYELLIFNRWGEMIFQTTDLKEGWTGTYKDEYVPTGGYPFLIYYKGNSDREKQIHKGMVVVMR